MNAFLETIITVVALLVPLSIMGMAAWLIYQQREGWGWFLIAALLIVGSWHFEFKGFGS